MTVAYVIRGPNILLGYKIVRIGKGLYNGFGGHIEPGESALNAAGRELKEESNIIALNLIYCGLVLVLYKDKKIEVELHYFITNHTSGSPYKSSDEFDSINWFRADDPPYGLMWPSDRIILPIFLADKLAFGRILMDHPEKRNLIKHDIRIVNELPAEINAAGFYP